MGVYNTGLETIQIAREATPGTDLAATSKWLVTSFEAKPASTNYRPKVLRGLIQRNRGYATVVQRGTTITVAGPVSYEQLQHLLCGALINVAAPTGAGPYIWTFTKNPAVIPTPCTFTIERDEYDGTTHIGHAWHYCVMTKLTLTFAEGQPITFEAEFFARRRQTEAITSALSLPTPEIPAVALATVFIDTTFAGAGGTQVASQVLSGSIEIMTGAYPIYTMDGRTDEDFTTIGFDPDQVGNNLKLLTLLGAQYATELAAAEANTLRAVRLAVAGSSGRALAIDALYKHADPELFEFGDQDGAKIVELNLEEDTDGTNFIKAILTNNIATFA